VHTPISIEGRFEKSKMALLKSIFSRSARSWIITAAAIKSGRGEGPCRSTSQRGNTRSSGKISETCESKKKKKKKKRVEKGNGSISQYLQKSVPITIFAEIAENAPHPYIGT